MGKQNRRSVVLEPDAAGIDIELRRSMSRSDRIAMRNQHANSVFQLPTSCAPIMMPSSMSVSRDKPLQMTVLPGGGSCARAR